jgi:uncharacterized membrane protein
MVCNKAIASTALLLLLLTPIAGLSQPPPAVGQSVGVGGAVVNREGSPIEGVSVVVYDTNNNVVGSAVTGPSGRFLVPLTTGTYTLKLSKPGYVDKTVQFTVGKGSFYTELGTIVLDYSVAISLPLASLSLPVLGVATVPVTVSNRGSSPENITLEIGGNCSLSVGLYSGSVQVGSLLLNPGDTQSLTLKVETPYMQNATCLVQLRFFGSVVQERKLLVNVVNQPLSLISAQLTSVRVAPGAVLQLPVRISNKLSDAFRARIALELPGGWSGVVKDAAGNVVDEVYLNPGENIQAYLMLSVPRGAGAGTYAVNLRLEGVDPYFLDSLRLTVGVASGAPVLRLSTSTPHVDAYAGKSAKYQVVIANLGDADCLAALNVTGLPQGYRWTITDAQGNTLSQVYLPAGGSATLVLSASVPPLAEPTAISFKLTASAGSSADELPLSLGVLGRYELSFVTQNFYLEITPGSSGAFELQLRNTGYSSLTNVAVTPVSVPSGFTVDVNPPNVLLLKPSDTATFTVTLSTQATVDAGDYYVTLVVKADQLDPASRDLHVYVRAASSTAYYMLALVAILIVAAVLAYRRFGRR